MNIIKIDPINPEAELLLKAAKELKSGGIVVYPTDTAYGIGVNALNTNAVRKLYELKGREFSKPTHVVVKDWEMLKEISMTNMYAETLIERFLPGPLTIILPKLSMIPNILTANLPTIGIRIPNSPVTRELSKLVDFPYTTPSANRNGKPTPYSIEEVEKVLDLEKVCLVLDAGPLPNKKPSTLVEASEYPFKILRQGPVTSKEIEASGLRVID